MNKIGGMHLSEENKIFFTQVHATFIFLLIFKLISGTIYSTRLQSRLNI